MHRSSSLAALCLTAAGVTFVVLNLNIVRAELLGPAGSVSYTCKTGTACIQSDSTGSGTYAIYAKAKKDDAISAEISSGSGHSAVVGRSAGSGYSTRGVYGRSSNGKGVRGESTFDFGVEGIYAGNGYTSVQAGVYGFSSTAAGMEGESNDNTGDVVALQALGDKPYDLLFEASNFYYSFVGCFIDQHANLSCTGKIGAAGLHARHRNSAGQHVLTHASESASATIEDGGTARMYDGVANVRIDPAFASLMDHRWYHVLLTPMGETRGLYVSIKTPAAFQVRENERGRSGVEFDYRIIAHPLDAGNDRLPPAPEIPKPVPANRP